MRLSILSVWHLIDPLYYWFTRLQYIEASNKKKAVFRVRLTKYKGRDIILSDGTSIAKNDVLVKVHLHNVRLLSELMKTENSLTKGKIIIKQVLESMPLLADYITSHPKEQNIKGVIGITMINKGVKRLGFETFEPANSLYKTVKWLTQLPILFLSSSNSSLTNLSKQRPIYLLMSKEQLIDRYSPEKQVR
ncbi:YkoP family protein [Mesobacillus harenae]|uniref:YkoP family protein n=1 Tax=Mesobacillus harenae TaxID=2213203 RepID=UPI00157FE862